MDSAIGSSVKSVLYIYYPLHVADITGKYLPQHVVQTLY